LGEELEGKAKSREKAGEPVHKAGAAGWYFPDVFDTLATKPAMAGSRGRK
jgi:hypothetical protein